MTKYLLSISACMLLLAGISQAQNYQWAKQFGGNSNDVAGAVVTDAAGNVYVSGWFQGTITIGSTTLSSHGNGNNNDIFLAKLDSNGTVQWALREGGTGDDRGYGVTVDGSGNVYTTGQIGGTDTFGTGTVLTTVGGNDLFIAKYNSSGSLQWAISAGSQRGERSNAITMDDSNNLYICGFYGQTAGGPGGGGSATVTFGSSTVAGVGGTDFFVAKADPTGKWVWGIGTGGRNQFVADALSDIVYANSSIYVSGAFADTVTVGKTSLISGGGSDAIWIKITKQGIPLAAGTAGGRQTDNATGITADNSGNIYLCGGFNQSMNPGSGSMKVGNTTLNANGMEAWVAGLDANLNVKWASSYGSTNNETATRISADKDYNLFVGGIFQTATTIGSTNYTSAGNNDGYLMMLDSGGTVLWSKAYGTTNGEDIRDVASDARGQYAVGTFGTGGAGGGGGTLAFNGSISLTASGTSSDGYCVKLYNCPGLSPAISLSGSPNFCQSGSVTMTAVAGASSYQWYMNGSPVSGATQDTLTVFAAGQYYCLLTNSGGCQMSSATTTVNIGTPPNASLSSVATQLCQGDSLIMTAGAGSNYKYRYYLNNSAITGWVTSTTLYAKQAGDYKVEVDNFGCSAFSSTITITQISVPTVTIKAIGSSNICVGDTVILQSDTSSTWTYSWQRQQGGNYIAIAGQNSDIFYCTAVGTFRMLVSTQQGCNVPSNTITITTSGPANANLFGTPGNGTLCKGDSVRLQTGGGGGGGGITYQWYKDGNPISGATNRVYTIKTSGTFYVELTGGGCTVKSKDTIVTFINESADVQPSGSAGLCPGDTVHFMASGDAGSTFSWFRNSNSIPGATQSNYNATQTGNYSCVISLGSCSYQSPDVAVTLFAAAPVPGIVQNGNNLASTISGTSYTWYLNNTAVVGTTQFIYGWQSGFYKVVVTDANGCKGESALFSFTNNAIGSAVVSKLNIYPNPGSGLFTLELKPGERTTIAVTDLTGRQVLTENVIPTSYQHTLNLNNCTNGVYVVRVATATGVFVNKVEVKR